MTKKIVDKSSVKRNYRFLAILLAAMVAGALVGWFWPDFGHKIAFLGKVFINMMFCIVVPLVFASIAGSIAGMESRHRAGKIMGTTVATFVITGAIAAVIMFVLMKIFPPVLVPWSDLASEEMGEYATLTEMIVNFFTAEDFVGLLTRRAMLPLIVFSVLFGFAVQMTGGKESAVGKWLMGLSDVMLKFVQIITYDAPLAFFAIFADLVATYGAEVFKGYGRAMLVYYPLCFLYLFTAFPLFACFGGGKRFFDAFVFAHEMKRTQNRTVAELFAQSGNGSDQLVLRNFAERRFSEISGNSLHLRRNGSVIFIEIGMRAACSDNAETITVEMQVRSLDYGSGGVSKIDKHKPADSTCYLIHKPAGLAEMAVFRSLRHAGNINL